MISAPLDIRSAISASLDMRPDTFKTTLKQLNRALKNSVRHKTEPNAVLKHLNTIMTLPTLF